MPYFHPMNLLSKYLLSITVLLLTITHSKAQTTPQYRDANASEDARVNSLLHTLTLQEKIDMLGYVSPGVQRLDIPAYNWWNEGLHGIARAGEATIFPQAIGMAATFNDDLLKQVSTVISTAARAKYNLAIAQDH